MSFTPRYIGAANTLEHRVYIEHNGTPVSAWHDIPLFASQNNNQNILNMIVAAPRWTDAAMELSKDESFNPLKQAVKRNKLRFVRSCFPHHGYIWNYGVFPQTWEDPAAVHAAAGGNGPVDVCEIGEQVGYVGQIKQVKVLGVIAALDEGAIDWKVIVVDLNDPLADKLKDIEDVERELPGLIRATSEWLRIYKIPDGKPENKFALSGEAKNKKYATAVVRECHEAWRRLVRGESSPGNNSITNLTVERSPGRVHLGGEAHAAIPADSRKPPAPVDPSISKWFHLSAV